MASLSGSSPARRHPKSSPGQLWWCLLAWALAALPVSAEMPTYLRTALANFSPGVPPGWACTITTIRNDETLVERFDPSHPTGGQWTLLRCHDRAPTADEQEKYLQSRPPGSSVGPQANFQKNDIEPGSLTLVSEDGERAEFKGAFRSESSGADKMLAHLVLHLTVNKQHPFIERYAISLVTPYSPVLAVKMNTLEVEARFASPDAEHPVLPSTYSSRFAGRIIFIANEETLTVAYSDFARTP